MNNKMKNLLITLLRYSSIELFVLIFIFFGLFTRNWFTGSNFAMIIKQASYIGILAIGITFPLITAGTDLSVGAVMFMSMSIVALMIEKGQSLFVAFTVAIAVGIVIGLINGFFVVKVRVMPFIGTLATMTIIRGITLILTDSRAMNLPQYLTIDFGNAKLFGFLPYPVLVFIILLVIFHFILSRTPLGRRIYACGNNLEAAKKAGINTDLTLFSAYVICSFLAVIAGFVSATQIGNVPYAFGDGYEFDAIAASVLGGTSLLGGAGSILPGVVIGAVTIQMITAGLTAMQINIYLIDIFKAMFILLAVILDCMKNTYITKLETRSIRAEKE